jgi:hypothetical protein
MMAEVSLSSDFNASLADSLVELVEAAWIKFSGLNLKGTVER